MRRARRVAGGQAGRAEVGRRTAGRAARAGTRGAGGNKGGQGSKGREEDKEEEEAESAVQELLRVADQFQAGGLYEHCLAEFGRTLTVVTALPQLVWAHAHAPEGRSGRR